MAIPKLRNRFHEALYSSATLTGNGNSGIIAVPGVENGGNALIPLILHASGTGLATDETAAITIGWYTNAAGAGGAVGTTTFDTLTAGAPNDLEGWPGDVTVFNAGRDLVPFFPYMQVNWTLAGTTISLSFIIYASYLRLDA